MIMELLLGKEGKGGFLSGTCICVSYSTFFVHKSLFSFSFSFSFFSLFFFSMLHMRYFKATNKCHCQCNAFGMIHIQYTTFVTSLTCSATV